MLQPASPVWLVLVVLHQWAPPLLPISTTTKYSVDAASVVPMGAV